MQTAATPEDTDDSLPAEAASPDLVRLLPWRDSAVPARQRIPALRHALASYPNSAPHWLQLGIAHLATNSPCQAEPAFRAALRIDARLHMAKAGLARALTMQ